MSLSVLREELRRPSSLPVVSSDLFDTVLLRDHTTESARLAAACARAARELGVDPRLLTRLRWSLHACAYRAVAMRNPDGDASLVGISHTLARSMGLGADAASVLRAAEISVDVEHLGPNRALVDVLTSAAANGSRLIAVSDMYYSGADLCEIVSAVVGRRLFDAVYSSSDLGRTKRSGTAFDEVARREGVLGTQIVHVGDDYEADVRGARAAGWTAVHLPRRRAHRVTKIMGKVIALSGGNWRAG